MFSKPAAKLLRLFQDCAEPPTLDVGVFLPAVLYAYYFNACAAVWPCPALLASSVERGHSCLRLTLVGAGTFKWFIYCAFVPSYLGIQVAYVLRFVPLLIQVAYVMCFYPARSWLGLSERGHSCR